MNATSIESPDSPDVLARFYEMLPAVRTIATELHRHLTLTVALGDLVSFGHEGLLHAARGFDLRHGITFRRWATLRVTWAILDGLRASGTLPFGVYRRARRGEALYVDMIAAAKEVGALVDGVCDDEPQAPDVSPEDTLARTQTLEAVREAVARLPELERALFVRRYFDDAMLTIAAKEVGVSKAWGSRVLARAVSVVARDLRRRGIEP